MRFNEVEKKLLKEGFVLVRSNKHKVYKKGNKVTAIPLKNKEVKKGTLKGIEKQTGITF